MNFRGRDQMLAIRTSESISQSFLLMIGTCIMTQGLQTCIFCGEGVNIKEIRSN